MGCGTGLITSTMTLSQYADANSDCVNFSNNTYTFTRGITTLNAGITLTMEENDQLVIEKDATFNLDGTLNCDTRINGGMSPGGLIPINRLTIKGTLNQSSGSELNISLPDAIDVFSGVLPGDGINHISIEDGGKLETDGNITIGQAGVSAFYSATGINISTGTLIQTAKSEININGGLFFGSEAFNINNNSTVETHGIIDISKVSNTSSGISLDGESSFNLNNGTTTQAASFNINNINTFGTGISLKGNSSFTFNAVAKISNLSLNQSALEFPSLHRLSGGLYIESGNVIVNDNSNGDANLVIENLNLKNSLLSDDDPQFGIKIVDGSFEVNPGGKVLINNIKDTIGFDARNTNGTITNEGTITGNTSDGNGICYLPPTSDTTIWGGNGTYTGSCT